MSVWTCAFLCCQLQDHFTLHLVSLGYVLRQDALFLESGEYLPSFGLASTGHAEFQQNETQGVDVNARGDGVVAG